jgi:hypothetical protein
MNSLPEHTSTYEPQLAMALLAHAARHDDEALKASLDLLADPTAGICSACLVAALLAEFQNGMDAQDPERLAAWFSGQALALAAGEFGKE